MSRPGMTVTFDKRVINAWLDVPRNCAKASVAIIEEEFVELLKNAPQKSGNYVANMSIAAGDAIGDKFEAFSPDPTEAQIVARGSLPAIEVAKARNKNLKQNVTRHIVRGSGGWLPSLTIYNRVDYAMKVEGYSASSLRKANKAGVHAMTKAKHILRNRLKSNLVYGSPEFKRLVGSNVL